MQRTEHSFQYLLAVIFLLVPTVQQAVFPCTVAVVSGKATPDGRPLLWKNRDTATLDNKIDRFNGEKYSFIALVDARNRTPNSVWGGINSEGFAIINSASSDLAPIESGQDDNGSLMKRALAECANASDFENLLQRTTGKRRVGANFGVIDAEGNACIYETSREGYQRFDANDPKVAPRGYVVRTNYAFTAPKKDAGGGYIRFERASRLFLAASDEGRLDYQFILREAARDLVNEKLHSYPLANPGSEDPGSPLYVNTNDTINRNSTASVVLFQGVGTREKAALATMWVILGQPVCSVAVPLWTSAESVPKALTGPETAPLNDLSRALEAYLYPETRGHMSQYLSITRLVKNGREGVLGRLFKIEDQVFAETEAKMIEWERTKPDKKAFADFEERISGWVYESLRNFPGHHE